MEDQERKEYELSFLLRTEEALGDVLAVLKSHEGEIGFGGTLKKIPLMYPVKKATEAFWGYCHFKMPSSLVHAVDKDLTLTPSVLRFLILTPPFAKRGGMVYGREGREAPPRVRESAPSLAPRHSSLPLSNEDLEKKIGEILQ